MKIEIEKKTLVNYKLSLTDDEITYFYQILEEAVNNFDENREYCSHYNLCNELMAAIDKIDRDNNNE